MLHIFFSTSTLSWQLSQPGGSELHAEFAETLHCRLVATYSTYLAQLVAEHDRSGLGRSVSGAYIAPFKTALDFLATSHSAESRAHSGVRSDLWNAIALALNSVALPHGDLPNALSALPEDVEFRGLGPFEQLHKELDFRPSARTGVLEHEHIYRAARIRARGLHLAACANVGLRVNHVSGGFLVLSPDGGSTVIAPTVPPHMVLSADVFDDRKFKTHRDREVNEQLGRHDYHPVKPTTVPKAKVPAVSTPAVRPNLVVLDTECLTGSLRLVEQLVASGQFKVMVPMAVHGALETRVRSSASGKGKAAEALRFLASHGVISDNATTNGAESAGADPEPAHTDSKAPRNSNIRLQVRSLA